MFLDKKIDSLPTSGVVCIQYDTKKWEEVEIAKAKIAFIIYPSIIGKSQI
jgi:hypothetical protein